MDKVPQQIGEAIRFFKTRDWSVLLKDAAVSVGEFYRYSGMLCALLCDCEPGPPHYDSASQFSITCAPYPGGGYSGPPQAHRNCICPRYQTHFAKAMS